MDVAGAKETAALTIEGNTKINNFNIPNLSNRLLPKPLNEKLNNNGFCSCRLTSSVLKVIDKQILEGNNSDSDENDSEEKEIISFSHACIQCNHVVAKHMHEFWIEEGYQEYRMECLLCGTGQDSISVMPKDPRKVSCSVQI